MSIIANDFQKSQILLFLSVGHYMENGQSVKRSDLRFQRLITIDSNDFEEIEELVETRLSKIKFI
ncbi:MAG: hypothetical protein IPQ11_05555 [Bacteroidetes bacterium]|nr:hypothetical protein [Bacteroidota bacterium]